MLDPWSYEDKYKDTRNAESASQRALFMWANMAANFGLSAADNKQSYSVKDYAKFSLENYKDQIIQLKYLFAIHNQGHGDQIHGAMAAAQGVKRGVSDCCLPVTIECKRISFEQSIALQIRQECWGYAGLYIELKRKQLLTEGKRKAQVVARTAGKASTEQEDWQTFLREQGYVCEICYGFDEARNLIIKYLREGGLI